MVRYMWCVWTVLITISKWRDDSFAWGKAYKKWNSEVLKGLVYFKSIFLCEYHFYAFMHLLADLAAQAMRPEGVCPAPTTSRPCSSAGGGATMLPVAPGSSERGFGEWSAQSVCGCVCKLLTLPKICILCLISLSISTYCLLGWARGACRSGWLASSSWSNTEQTPLLSAAGI